ncbi:MAG: PEGA domain-containing protein [Gallionellaceae bacterium]|nr:PEGA domain-containing protein [Gallionellaceae bacterium]
MQHSPFRTCLVSLLIVVLSTFSVNLYAEWFKSDDTINLIETPPKNPVATTPVVKNSATIRIAGYVDARKDMSPKKIGTSNQRISGIWGKELLIDRELSQFVAESIKKAFDDAGFKIVQEGALYEIGGVIKELTYNVKAKDEVSILIETTIKEVATGKVVWSGAVAEKNERFAGVSGNNKKEIAAHLRRETKIVTQKTMDAISSTLIVLRPELFNMTPGTKAIAGVTVLQSSAASQPAVIAPAVSAATNGVLVLNTKPSRAKIYLDGVYFGMSPLRAEVDVGVHEVSVKLDGYKVAAEKISMRKGDTTELEMVLEH